MFNLTNPYKTILLLGCLMTFGCRHNSTNNNKHLFNTEDAPIELTWKLNTNYLDSEQKYSNTLTIKNISKKNISKNWSIYFNQLPRDILSQASTRDQLEIKKINGDFFTLKPKENFIILKPDSSLSITFVCPYWAIKESDSPSGFYFISKNEAGIESSPIVLECKTIPIGIKKIKRSEKDLLEAPTPSSIFKENELIKSDQTPSVYDILPRIKKIKLQANKQELEISQNLKVIASNSPNEVDLLKQYLSKANYLTTDSNTHSVPLYVINNQLDSIDSLKFKPNTYWIRVDSSGITLKGTSASAIGYGIQTIRSILSTKQGNIRLPYAEIEDYPDLEYRGLFIDVSRNFQPKSQLIKLLDLVALYKINKFQIHLSDDEGWRIEIKGLEELTEIGAKRGHVQINSLGHIDESKNLHPSYGSGPFADEKLSPGTGYYTASDFVEILKYAAARHIEIIPEIDLPGHARAAIISMRKRFNKYILQNDTIKAREYLLSDPQDQSEYRSVQGYTDNTVCIGSESTYHFLEKIVIELSKIYAEAGIPLKTIHIGGDEVPQGAWNKCPSCNLLITQNNKSNNRNDLTEYFLKRTINIFKKHKITISGWQEIGLVNEKEPNIEFASKSIRTYCWSTIKDWGGIDIPYKLANAGYSVILCNAPNFYFDFAYNKDPRESGYYWGGFVDEKTSFNMLPYNIYNSIRIDRNGNKIDWKNTLEQGSLTSIGEENILGVQGQIWSETVTNSSLQEYYLLPKMYGLVERGWNSTPLWSIKKDNVEREKLYSKDLTDYMNIIGHHELPLIQKINHDLNFRVPAPGILKTDSGLIHMNSEFSSLDIRYTTDGTIPDIGSNLYVIPFKTNSTKIRAKAFLGNKSSLETVFNISSTVN